MFERSVANSSARIPSKAKLANAEQSDKILDQSIYGRWYDENKRLSLKISPDGQCLRVKILEVFDDSIIDMFAGFCGLDARPKRTKWNGFYLVTHLQRVGFRNFDDGLVHMPKSLRKNQVSALLVDNHKMLLEFYFSQGIDHNMQKRFVGSLMIRKVID